MKVELTINGNLISDDIEPDMTLLSFVRKHGCYSVKCGCETTNCGLCTVLVDGKPILSCAKYAVSLSGHEVTTLEGVKSEAEEINAYIAAEGADQCGFCHPGYIMNAIAMFRENPYPTRSEIEEYMAGNLCRCTGYESKTRALELYVKDRKEKEHEGC